MPKKAWQASSSGARDPLEPRKSTLEEPKRVFHLRPAQGGVAALMLFLNLAHHSKDGCVGCLAGSPCRLSRLVMVTSITQHPTAPHSTSTRTRTLASTRQWYPAPLLHKSIPYLFSITNCIPLSLYHSPLQRCIEFTTLFLLNFAPFTRLSLSPWTFRLPPFNESPRKKNSSSIPSAATQHAGCHYHMYLW